MNSKWPKIGQNEIKTNTMSIYNNDLINYGLETNKGAIIIFKRQFWHLKSEAQ